MKDVSIIIPIYNVEKYVAECINSVISQTYDHSKIECIIVNDCTPDKSMDIVHRIIDDYSGNMAFRIINHEKNMGLSVSRNDGINIANGNFLFFIDSDDYIYSNCIELLLSKITTDDNVDLVIGNAYNEENNTRQMFVNKLVIVNNMNYLYMGDIVHCTVWNTIILKSIIKENNIRFAVGISNSEDDLFNYQLMPFANKAIVMPQITYFYRKNSNGQSKHIKFSDLDKTLNGYVYILEKYENDLSGTCYVGKSYFAFNLLSRAIYFMESNYDNVKGFAMYNKILSSLKRKLLRIHFNNCRIVLFLMTLLVEKPFVGLLKCHLYRRYFDSIISLFLKPAMLFDKIHVI